MILSPKALKAETLYKESQDARKVAAKLGVKVTTVRRWLRTIQSLRARGDAIRVRGPHQATREHIAMYERGRHDEREACAAYCLDRADQYDTSSGTWPALADAAEGIAKGEAAGMMARGETEDLLKRVRRIAGFTRKTPKVKAKAKA